jgi:carbon-monoxide dehydrogenase medium subunit
MSSSYFTLPEFEYLRPTTIDEVKKLLNEYGEEAKILAGGIGLVGFMKERLLMPGYVIDIKGIPELKRLEYLPGDGLYVGATVTFRELYEFLDKDKELKAKYRALYEAIPQLSDSIIRNRSTLVGNVCEAIPYMDSYPSLLIYDAVIHSVSVEGERDIPIRGFLKGFATTELKENEFVTYIKIPEPPKGAISSFIKFVSHSEFSVATVAILIKWDPDKGKRDVRIAYGSVTETPVRLVEAERLFKEDRPIDELVDQAVKIALDTMEPMSDLYGTAEYRRHLVEVLTRKLFVELFKEV